MLPVDIDISTEMKEHAILLGDVQSSVIIVNESKFTLCTEGYADRHVL